MEYEDIPVNKAYELQNAGGLVIVCTRGRDGRYDLAPVAWSCPLELDPVSRMIVVCDTGHRTCEDLAAAKEFALALPSAAQAELVMRTGSVSGRAVDKYEKFGIAWTAARKVDARIPQGVAGWIECRLMRIVTEGSSAIVLGEVVAAAARPEAWKERLHYVREGIMFSPGPALG
jgi:flavin reductase (DIM6/NTAB) family NADH-FMN oxidoreductase RutF